MNAAVTCRTVTRDNAAHARGLYCSFPPTYTTIIANTSCSSAHYTFATADRDDTPQTLSPRALEKRAVRDPPAGSSPSPERTRKGEVVNTIPQAPAPTYQARPTSSGLPLAHPQRPQTRYRSSFLQTFLARQQNKEGTTTSPVASSSRIVNPINHIPRPTPVHIPQVERIEAFDESIDTGAEKTTLLSLPAQRRSRQNSPRTPEFQDSFVPSEHNSHRTSIGLPRSHRSGLSESSQVQSPALPEEGEEGHEMAQTQTQEKALAQRLIPDRKSSRGHLLSSSGDGSSIPAVPLQQRLATNYGMHHDDQPTQPPRQVSSQRSLRHIRSISSIHSSGHNRTDGDPLPPVPPLVGIRATHDDPQTQLPAHQHPTPTTGQAISPNTDPGDGGLEAFDAEPPWGPGHPCFPHLNPHVPKNSPLYTSTRIIRMRRDWMVVGDLAPTYSNIYPEILDPALPENEFRFIIDHINTTLISAYNPYRLRNWVDGTLGLLTGWIWEDLRPGGIKGALKGLDRWMEKWNEKVGARQGVKLIGLRRTAYTCLDIQIPDPKVRNIDDDEVGDEE